MLDQSIERVTATVKRTRLGLIMGMPAVPIGALLASAVESSSGDEIASRIAAYEGLGTAILLVAGLGFSTMATHLFRQFRRSPRELERLILLREAYRQEHEWSKGD